MYEKYELSITDLFLFSIFGELFVFIFCYEILNERKNADLLTLKVQMDYSRIIRLYVIRRALKNVKNLKFYGRNY